MRRSLKLALDEFGRATLEGEAARFSISPGELIGHAVEYYLGDRSSGRPGLRIPRFARAANSSNLELDVDLDGRTWEEAEAEARRQHVPLERLLEHAALYLIADLDSGQVAARLATNSRTPDQG